MTLLADILCVLWATLRGVIDTMVGAHRRRYVTAIDIKAPMDVVWNAASAHSIVFEGPPRIEIETAQRPGTTDVFEGFVRVGEREVPTAYREIEMRPREAMLIEILRDGSAPSVAPGRDYYVACKFEETPAATRMTMIYELTHEGFLGRVVVPLGARHNARRMRDHCEATAGTAGNRTNRIGAAAVTGALTYASFAYLFDWHFAAVLFVLLLIHEAGHALAMYWVGLPVQGIYFIPFFDGVAVSSARHRSEAERGFVALMGPGVSLVTTGAFVIAGFATGEPLFEQLALVSALLNGINLAPVLPLDGGHVADAALSRSDPDMVGIINMLALIVGAAVSVYLEWYVLTALLVLTAPMLVGGKARKARMEPISPAGRNWLVAGYLATVAFYIAVAAHYLV